MADDEKAAGHQARIDAFGPKDEKGDRDYNSGGDRPTEANRAEADKVGQEHGLPPQSKK